jgi:hypothetical protein
MITGLDDIREIVGNSTKGDASGNAANSTPDNGGSTAGDASVDDATVVDVRGASDVVAPPGSYIMLIAIDQGRVISDPVGIDCYSGSDPDGGPHQCTAAFPGGTEVRLTATGLPVFNGWTGVCAPSLTPQCNVVMSADVYLTLSFSPHYR